MRERRGEVRRKKEEGRRKKVEVRGKDVNSPEQRSFPSGQQTFHGSYHTDTIK
jgi:hypothetical protein